MIRINNNKEVFLSVKKDGDKIETELLMDNICINRKGGKNLRDLSAYEGKKISGTVDSNIFVSASGEKLIAYDSVFCDVIGDAVIEGDNILLKVGDTVVETVPKTDKTLVRKQYKASIRNDRDWKVIRYANLHQHTENSLLDGIVRISELADKAEYACAITDHGNMFGWYDMKKAFDKAGKKAIIGEEFYIQTFGGKRFDFSEGSIRKRGEKNEYDVDELMFDKEKKQNEEGFSGEHLIVLAKNDTGLKNLFRLSSEASMNFYRKPHITYELLEKYSEGLIVMSACIAGGICQFIKTYLKAKSYESVASAIETDGEAFYMSSDYLEENASEAEKVYAYSHKKARELIEWFYRVFGEDFYLEYQDHHFPLENQIMNELVSIQKNEYPFVKIAATTDAHYLNKEDSFVHELWLCNQTKTTMDNPSRMKFSGDGYYVHTSEEMMNKFPIEYLDTTLEIADKICYEKQESGYHLPHFPLPEGFKDEESYLRHKCRQGYRKLFKGTQLFRNETYIRRMQDELNTIVKMGWPAYFLIVSDFIQWAEDANVESHWKDYFPDMEKENVPSELLKRHKIYVGSGRGSGAGSLVNYCLGITKVDPIRYELKFERFLNPDRISMPDIDTDFEDGLRPEVLDYVRFKYGRTKVANVITFGTCAAKNSIKVIARVTGETPDYAASISDLVPGTPGMTIRKAMDNSDFRMKYESDEKAHRIIDLAGRIEGLKSSQSIHPCATLITDKSITEYMPEILMTNPSTKNKEWTVQMEGPACEELGCLKMDFLGLKTLGYVHECIDLIKKNTGKDIDYDSIPLNDIGVYKFLADGNTASVFQCESEMFTSVIRKTLKDLDKASGNECFNRLVAMNALVRPGSNAFIEDFSDRIVHNDHITYMTPELEHILNETYGIILYQEQTMQITRDLAGFSAGQADTVRKAMGKKKKYIMDEYKDYFVNGNTSMNIKGCVAAGIDQEKASELWDVMAMASSYSFNKSHAVAYSMHSIRTAWLSCYYPYEYITAVLNSCISDSDKLSKYLGVARKKGMIIHSPSLNISGLDFTTDGKAILAGLSGIRDVGAISRDILSERAKKGCFSSTADFLARMSSHHNFSKKTIEAMAYAGVLDTFEAERYDVVCNVQNMADYVISLKEFRKKYLNYLMRAALYPSKMREYEKSLSVKGIRHIRPRMPKKPEKPQTFRIEASGKKMDAMEKLSKEKEYTGMYLSGDPVELFKDIADITLDCSALKEGKSEVVGVIENAEIKHSSKGNRFWTFSIENHGMLKCILFNYDGEIADGMVVKISGNVEIDDYGPSMKIREVEDLGKEASIINGFDDLILKAKIRQKATDLKNINYSKGTRNVFIEYRGKLYSIPQNPVVIDLETASKIIAIIGLEGISFKEKEVK